MTREFQADISMDGSSGYQDHFEKTKTICGVPCNIHGFPHNIHWPLRSIRRPLRGIDENGRGPKHHIYMVSLRNWWMSTEGM